MKTMTCGRVGLVLMGMAVGFPITRAADLEADLTAKSAQVDELMGQNIKPDIPGAAVLVILDGKKVHEKGYGLANLATQAPLRPNTVFELASCSKQFTAMAIMILADRGKLKYEDHLARFFPEFHAFGESVTVEHLLHHTAGLPDYMDLWAKTGKEGEPTSRELLRILAQQTKLQFPPGKKYNYSNSGYLVLAQIVEKVSGMKFSEFVHKNIFAPLGMHASLVYDDTKPVLHNHAICYGHNKKTGGFKRTDSSELNLIYGDGSVRSSIEDLFHWDQALYTEKLVSTATLERAFTEGKLNSGEGTGYGFGWEIGEFRKVKEVSHAGAWLDWGTEIMRVPERHFSVIVLSNLGKFNSDAVAHKIAGIYLPPKKTPRP